MNASKVKMDKIGGQDKKGKKMIRGGTRMKGVERDGS